MSIHASCSTVGCTLCTWAHPDVPQTSENREQLNTERARETWCNSSKCHWSGCFKHSQCSLPHAFPAFFFLKGFVFFLVGWMKSRLCRAKPTKQSWSRIQKSQWKIPILWLFPAQALLPDTFSPVYDWLSQLLVQDKWGECGDRAHCRELCLWQGWTCLGCEGLRVPSEGHLPLPPASPLTSSKQNQMGVSLR